MAEPNPDDPLVAEIVIIILLHCTSVAFISRDMTCIIGDHIIFNLSTVTVISTHNIIAISIHSVSCLSHDPRLSQVCSSVVEHFG